MDPMPLSTRSYPVRRLLGATGSPSHGAKMLLQEWRAVLSTACLVLAYGKFAWPWSGVKVTVFPPDAEWVADEPSA